MRTAKVGLARALAVDRFAVVADGAVQVALARPTVRVAKVSVRAGVAVRRVELRSALAATRFLLAVAGRVEVIAVAG